MCTHNGILHACILSRFSHVQLFATPGRKAIACQAPLSIGLTPSSRGSSRPRDRTCVSYISCIGRQALYHVHHLGSPVEYYSALKRNKILLHATTWMSLQDIMLSETNSVMEGQIGFHFREVPRVEKCRQKVEWWEIIMSAWVQGASAAWKARWRWMVETFHSNVNVLNATEPCTEKWWGL